MSPVAESQCGLLIVGSPPIMGRIRDTAFAIANPSTKEITLLIAMLITMLVSIQDLR
jgi:hypothetical protein